MGRGSRGSVCEGLNCGAKPLHVIPAAGVRKMYLEAAVWTNGKQKRLDSRHEISIKDLGKR